MWSIIFTTCTSLSSEGHFTFTVHPLVATLFSDVTHSIWSFKLTFVFLLLTPAPAYLRLHQVWFMMRSLEAMWLSVAESLLWDVPHITPYSLQLLNALLDRRHSINWISHSFCSGFCHRTRYLFSFFNCSTLNYFLCCIRKLFSLFFSMGHVRR